MSDTLQNIRTWVVGDYNWPTDTWDVFSVSFDHTAVKVVWLGL